MPKIIICQSNFIYGGRLAVVIDIIKLLNDNGISPTVLTSSTSININKIKLDHDIKFDFLIKCKWIRFLPYEVQVIVFGLCVRLFARKHDLIINSNNTSILFPKNTPTVSYNHYPRKARIDSILNSIHFPEYGKTHGLRRIQKLILRRLYSRKTFYPKKEIIIANSNFTKEAIMQSYPYLNREKIKVIYPGVFTKASLEGNSLSAKENVVSLGRISPDKKQLEQIIIFSKLPKLKLTIAGYSDPQNNYYRKCLNHIKENHISNVEIIINLSEQEKLELLSNSKYYLHMTISEPFGITIVESISKGCIPIVHDSGGAKEIVRIDDLRYSDNLFELLERLNNGKNEHLYQDELQKNLNFYSKETFSQNMWVSISKQLLV
jgi:glycosyltransferase involved in cell wall biosynthesis